jgi:diguanylate cyclase (GGDEF)-like protein
MEVNETSAVLPLAMNTNGDERRDQGKRRDGGRQGDDENRWPVTDAVSVMGIPAEMLTPQVRQALDTLVEETERLRQALTWSRERQVNLEKLSDLQDFLPVDNRRAFVRDLENVLAQAAQLTTPASLVCLHVTNAEDIRRRFGRRALDQALAHVCRVLTDHLHATDIIGSLGGNDFGIVLLVASQIEAEGKAAALTAAIRSHPCQWQGREVGLGAAAAARELQPGSSADVVMEAVDRDLLAGRRADDAARLGADPETETTKPGP